MEHLSSIILSKTRYNYWANSKIANKAAELEISQLNDYAVSSFNSICKTIMHIWDAEYIWMQRLSGNEITYIPGDNIKDAADCLTFNEFSLKFHQFIENNFSSLSELERVITYKNLNGKVFQTPAFEIILHCMNHSTYHRGQVITLLRQAGLKNMPQTDYIAWLRESQ